MTNHDSDVEVHFLLALPLLVGCILYAWRRHMANGGKFVTRHSLNFVTGTLGCLWVAYRWSTPMVLQMFLSCTAVLVTTIIYHGAHCIGHERWADRVMMKYDFIAVAVSALSLIKISQPGSMRQGIIAATMFCFVIWIPSFHPCHKRLPLNPTQSILHMIGAIVHTAAASILAMGREGND